MVTFADSEHQNGGVSEVSEPEGTRQGFCFRMVSTGSVAAFPALTSINRLAKKAFRMVLKPYGCS